MHPALPSTSSPSRATALLLGLAVVGSFASSFLRAEQSSAGTGVADAKSDAAIAPAPSKDPTVIANPTSSDAAATKSTPGDTSRAVVDKRIFGVLPNYRTANESDPFQALTVKRKFTIAFKDSTDYPIFALAGAFAGLSQWDNSHPSFGQGAAGYARRYGTAFGDQLIGNFMTEAIMPSLLHQDPRYFRLGKGSTWSRVGYALSRIVVIRTDAGHSTFNASEIFGNAIAAGIANAYYPDERRLIDNFERLGTSLGTDAASQILKEFWPDVKRKILKHRHPEMDKVADSVPVP